MGALGKGLQDVDVVPVDSVSSREGVVSRSRLDPVESIVVSVVESVASFVFFHPVDEGSISLVVVGGRAVQAGDFVDGVGGKVGRRYTDTGTVHRYRHYTQIQTL